MKFAWLSMNELEMYDSGVVVTGQKIADTSKKQ